MRSVRVGDGWSTLYSAAEVARMLGVSTTTIRRYIKAGLIPAIRFPGKRFAIWEGNLGQFTREILGQGPSD